jgi:hypothetical protein
VLNGVRVMWTGHFKKFLKVIFGRLSLSLEMAFSSRYELLARVTGFLITGHYGNEMGSALWSLLAILSAFLGAIDGGLGGCGPTIVGSRSHVTRIEGGPDRLFTRSGSSCDVE